METQVTDLRERLGVGERTTEAALNEQAECNVFATSPDGYKVHFKLLEADSAKVVTRLKGLINVLKAEGFQPDGGPSSARSQSPTRAPASRPNPNPPQAPTNDNPACPDCGGETELKQGKAKNGRVWTGYFCIQTRDADQAHKHTPTWV